MDKVRNEDVWKRVGIESELAERVNQRVLEYGLET